jgi:AmmeMemoRadiSam system protein B
MSRLPAFVLSLAISGTLAGQAAPQAPGPVPTLEEVRKAMGIPSTDSLRGQQDAVGFASTAEQMAKVWALAEAPPAPEGFGPLPGPGVVGAILPHDDYLFAGRVYRRMVPLITARTVVLVGVFHKYRRFGAQDQVILEDYPAWRSPDGPIAVSPLRDELRVLLPPSDFALSPASHDSEHSLEAIAYWLRHQRPDLEILPILVPAASFSRFQALAAHLGSTLAVLMKRRGLGLGKDLAIVISSDGVHYGGDFRHTPFGEGGVEAYQKAMEQDRALLKGPLSGPLSADKARTFFAACVNPEKPDEYRLPWCGRFSIPFGMLLLEATVKGLGQPLPTGVPVAFGSSVDTPELPVKALGMGATAPANLYHFVSYPGVAFVASGR